MQMHETNTVIIYLDIVSKHESSDLVLYIYIYSIHIIKFLIIINTNVSILSNNFTYQANLL